MANDSLVRALRSYRFDQWRTDNPSTPIDLSGADLSGVSLHDVDLTGGNFAECRLDNCNSCCFKKGIFTGAMFGPAPGDSSRGGQGIYVGYCDFSDAHFGKARFNEVHFNTCDFRSACIEGIQAIRCRWRACPMTKLHVDSRWELAVKPPDFTFPTTIAGGCATLDHCEFQDCNLSDARLWCTNLGDLRASATRFDRAQLSGCYLADSSVHECSFDAADLSNARLRGFSALESTFRGVSFRRSDLSDCRMGAAHVRKISNWTVSPSGGHYERFEHQYRPIDCTGADFTGALLQFANLVRINLKGATLADCFVYGASVWGALLEDTIQRNIRVTALDEPDLTVDDLPMAQFIHMLAHSQSLRGVIDQITCKAVLLLGRFNSEGRARLDKIATVVRGRGLSPIIFDWTPPTSRDTTETVELLGRLSAFVIVDLTNPQSAPYEIGALKHLKFTPICPIIQSPQRPFSMFDDIARSERSVQALATFSNDDDLVRQLDGALIDKWLHARRVLLPVRPRDELAADSEKAP